MSLLVLEAAIENQYKKAKVNGLWKGAYAMVDAGEHWAELSMWYFGRHGEFLKGTQSPSAGPEALKAYDADGYRLVDSIYSGRAKITAFSVLQPTKVSPGDRTNDKNGGKDAWFMITNNTSKKLGLYWVSYYDGAVKLYGHAPAYNSFMNKTYTGHVWQIKDARGRLLGCYRVTKPYTRIVIN